MLPITWLRQLLIDPQSYFSTRMPLKVYHTLLSHDSCVLARRHSFSIPFQVCFPQTQVNNSPTRGVLPWDMVDKLISPLQTSFRLFFVSG